MPAPCCMPRVANFPALDGLRPCWGAVQVTIGTPEAVLENQPPGAGKGSGSSEASWDGWMLIQPAPDAEQLAIAASTHTGSAEASNLWWVVGTATRRV